MAGQSEDGGGWIWLLIMGGLAFWYFGTAKKPLPIETSTFIPERVATISPSPPITPPAPAPTVKPPPPASETHNYDFAEDGSYGYVSAVSEEDRKRGAAVGDVLLFRYLGKTEGIYRLQWINDAGQIVGYYECPRKCGAIKSYSGGTMRRVPYNPRSLIGAAFEDAFLGKLRARPIKPLVAEPAIGEAIVATPSTDGAQPSQ